MSKTKNVFIKIALTLVICCISILLMTACETNNKGTITVTSEEISTSAFTGDANEFQKWRMDLLKTNITKVEYSGEEGLADTITFDGYSAATAAGVVFSGLNRAEASVAGSYTIKVNFKRAEAKITVTITVD